jgi:phosphohistidine phosphatase
MPEPTLVLLRHGKSDWSDDDVDDLRRPLAGRGERQAPEAGRWLAGNVQSIDLALVSPAVRARATWDLVAAELDQPPRALVDDRVYEASVDDLLSVVREIDHEAHTVVLVGHNPGLEDLAQTLTGQAVAMPTSALAVLTMSGSWSTAGPGSALLRHSGRPPGP